jgi:hypothetical protein
MASDRDRPPPRPCKVLFGDLKLTTVFSVISDLAPQGEKGWDGFALAVVE